uniref:Uncharacterized protein n=1 Tax=Anguilla anguilla TaxID=7936 RepID=A0A0E9X679_ANGAN
MYTTYHLYMLGVCAHSTQKRLEHAVGRPVFLVTPQVHINLVHNLKKIERPERESGI